MVAYWAARAEKVNLWLSVEGPQRACVWHFKFGQGSWKSWKVLERTRYMSWMWVGSVTAHEWEDGRVGGREREGALLWCECS